MNLTGSDTVIGGEGSAIDQLAFTTAGTIAASAFAKVSGIEQILLANGGNNLTLTNALVGSAYGDILKVTGGSGNDVINAAAVTTATNRVQITAGAGNDTLTGGAGADSFSFTVADLTSSDKVLGNVGDRTELVTPRDQIVFTTAGTITAAAFANIAGIERIVLANGSNQLTVSDALVASVDWEWTESGGWGTLVWLLDVVGGSGNDTINAAGVTTDMHALRIIAGAGHDTLTGGAGSDSFSFTTKDLTGNDKIVGGNGWDQLVFTTSGAITASAFANVSGIEQIVLATGSNTLTVTNALVGSAHEDVLNVLGGSGNDVINAAALTTAGNRMQITAGAGNDTLTGGAGADSFSFTAKDLTANDTVVGGAGSSVDRLVFTTAGTIAASVFSKVSGIDQIVLANGTNNLTLANALITSAKGMMLDVAGGSGNDVINASNVTATGQRITVSGGEGDDTIFGGAGADILDGGKGSDTLVVTGSANLIVRLDVDEEVDQTVGDTDIVRNFENFNGSGISAALTITGSGDANRLTGGSSHDIIDGKGGEDIISGGGGDDRIYLREWTLSLNGGSGNDMLVFDAMWVASIDFSAANQSLDDTMSITGFENFDGSGANSSVWIIGSSAANYLVGGGYGDTFVVGAGDTVFGGAGDDTVTVSANGSAPVYLHGGDAAWDRLVLSGGYDFSASTITGFEVLNLKATAKVTFTAAQWGQFEALSIDDSAPVTTFNIVFTEAGTLDVSTSEPNDNNNNYNITGSAGNDTIRGSTLSTSTIRAGEGDDVITLRGGYANGVQDKIYGEAGNDRIELVFGVDEATAPLFDGGTGSDTLTSTRDPAIIDLNSPAGTSQVTTASAYAFVRNFENVDWTGNTHFVRAYGSSGANTLIGGLGNDILEGRGGDDAIDGGAGNNTIDAGDGQDIITISIVNGATTITGGSGSDIFSFTEPNFVAGLTTITDFTDGEDVFRFKYMAYISDGPFVTTDGASLAGEVDISDTDLLRIDGGGVAQDTIKTYLEENSTTADGEGLFVVGRIGGVGSSVHLYFVADAGDPTEIVQVASLGANFNPGTLDGADFQFL
ncbi:hypothetical protein GB928_020480 [Shinella curvata]|uniref:Hemolysin type calcium-binding protein n=1 Tax=Shinella curvata TaxID=1817964 RepID=A0ABT8XIK7_9HYPH|nr:hypothetical protein [Shinella curvata]MDO6123577.1 hypothetical protein [Shinella curvata]